MPIEGVGDLFLGYLDFRWVRFSRPFGTRCCFRRYPGLASWAKVSRPFGTEFEGESSHTRS